MSAKWIPAAAFLNLPSSTVNENEHRKFKEDKMVLTLKKSVANYTYVSVCWMWSSSLWNTLFIVKKIVINWVVRRERLWLSHDLALEFFTADVVLAANDSHQITSSPNDGGGESEFAFGCLPDSLGVLLVFKFACELYILALGARNACVMSEVIDLGHKWSLGRTHLNKSIRKYNDAQQHPSYLTMSESQAVTLVGFRRDLLRLMLFRGQAY